MYPPHHSGGYELAWQSAMRYARAVGHEVRILTSSYRHDRAPVEDDPDVHRTLRCYWDAERYEFPHLSLPQRLEVERRNRAELQRQLREFRPDVIAWWSMGCMSLALIEQARRSGVPGIFLVHDDWLVYGWQHDAWIRIWRGRRKRLGWIAERIFGIATTVNLAAAGPIIFNSRHTLDRAQAAGVNARLAMVIYPGVDEGFLHPCAVDDWAWRLAYVGRIHQQKGVDTAVCALAHLPATASLTIWGQGDERYVAQIRALADRLGVSERVRFRGFASAEGLREAYAEADVVVFPVRWDEPFGLVPLEAMGMGRPVVMTARGGTTEFVQDGENALVCAPEDPAALAACIVRLGRDGQLRARIHDGGRRTAAQFTASRFAERTVEEIIRVATFEPAGAST